MVQRIHTFYSWFKCIPSRWVPYTWHWDSLLIWLDDDNSLWYLIKYCMPLTRFSRVMMYMLCTTGLFIRFSRVMMCMLCTTGLFIACEYYVVCWFCCVRVATCSFGFQSRSRTKKLVECVWPDLTLSDVHMWSLCAIYRIFEPFPLSPMCS